MAEYHISGSPTNGLAQQPWFWGDLDKEEARNLLMEAEHGCFLVRLSSNASTGPTGDYTLVVRKKDKVRSIRIVKGERGFGIVPDQCNFPSLVDLITHLQNNPQDLKRNFPMLDLLYHLPRPREVESETAFDLLYRLVQLNRELHQDQRVYHHHVHARKHILKEMQQCQLTITSLKAVQSLFEEQLAHHNARSASTLMQPAASTDEQDESIVQNKATVHDRVHSLVKRVQAEKGRLEEKQEEVHQELNELHTLKPRIKSLQAQISLLRLRVVEKQVSPEYLDLLLKMDSNTDLSHYDPSNWHVECDRLGAENLLADRDPGTFLVRPNRGGGQAISIKCEREGRGATCHCLIHRNPQFDSYGFHPGYCTFSSVEELVTRHRNISLKFYNPNLDVCLTYPINYNR